MAGLAQKRPRRSRSSQLLESSPRVMRPPQKKVSDPIPLTRAKSAKPSRASTRKARKSGNPRRRGSVPLQSVMLRTLGMSLMLGLVVGTVAHLLNRGQSSPTSYSVSASGSPSLATPRLVAAADPELAERLLGQRQIELENQLRALLEQPNFSPYVMTVDLESGSYAELRGSERVQAASVIKVPILVAFLQAWDRGEISLDEMLTLEERLAGGGAGTLQERPFGEQVNALTAARMMITISDNFATNLIIDRLGGKEALNEQFRSWGLEQTQISWLLPDLEGTNTISPSDMVALFQQIDAGHLISTRSRDLFFQIMGNVQNRTLIPAGLGNGSTIAHKTGNIRSVLADAGIVDTPNGRRYLVAIFLRRDIPSDPRAQELIPQASRIIDAYWRGLGDRQVVSGELGGS